MIFYSTTGDGPGYREVGLAHNPFNALVVPRPIGWISSVSAAGVANLAPYSFFNAVSSRPPMVMFTTSEAPGPKRTRSATFAKPSNSWSTWPRPSSNKR